MKVTSALDNAAKNGRLSALQAELRIGLCSINATDGVREMHLYHVIIFLIEQFIPLFVTIIIRIIPL
jgi:hypothetical protein